MGGLNRMLSVLEELIEEMTESDLKNLLIWYPHKSTLQRFGYLLEDLQPNNNLVDTLFEHFKSAKFYPVLLSPESRQKPGAVDNRWKVDINLILESDI